MAHLSPNELLNCFDSMFNSLYGMDLYDKWQHIKLQLKFETERTFVSWMLNVIEDNFLSMDEDGGNEMPQHQEEQDPEIGDIHSDEVATDVPPPLSNDDSPQHQNVKIEQTSSPHLGTCNPTPVAATSSAPYFNNQIIDSNDQKSAVLGLTIFTNTFDPTIGNTLTKATEEANVSGTDTISTIAPAATEKWFCQFCQAEFSTPTSLRLHVKYLHLKEHNQHYSCRSCPDIFSSQFERTQHESIAHPNLLKSFACDVCNKRFSSKKNMTAHRRSIHFNEKSYPCMQCDKVFSLSWNLNRHIRSSHHNTVAE